MRKPISHQLQPLGLDSVNPSSSFFLVSQEAGRFQDLKMPGCGWPGALEGSGYFPGCHRAAVEVDRNQHATPGCARECGKHRLINVHAPPGLAARHHTHIFSYIAKYLSKKIFWIVAK